MAIKNHVSDRTDWRKMLKESPEHVDLAAKRDELIAASEKELKKIEKEFGQAEIELLNEKQIQIEFPIEHYPEKVKSLNFDKTPEIEGVLQGIKGQYLILDSGVLNIRKFGGYNISFSS
jgi:hypothetical protein